MRTLELFALGTLAACMAAGAHTNPRADIATLDWLTGHWCQGRDDELVEEAWLAPRGGLMLGMGRTLRGGKVRGFEFLRIELHDGAPAFVAQPNGVPPTLFRLTASGANWARFENPLHDFPKRVEYRRRAEGLQAQIAGPGKDGGEQVITFDYVACVVR